MKTIYPFLILIASLISIACGQQTTSKTVPERAVNSIIESGDSLIWSSPKPGLDSMVGCNENGGKTRYFSTFYIDFTAGFPGSNIEVEDSTWELSLIMEVQLPGEFCLDTIPISFMAESDDGSLIPMTAVSDPPGSKSTSVGLFIAVNLTLPIHTDGTLNGGGLAIIVETIDPVTAFYPKLKSVAWEAQYAGETIGITALEILDSPGLTLLNPAPPSCEVCQSPDKVK